MERILQGGMERGYGTGVWNWCGPGAGSGPPILTCPHLCHVQETERPPSHRMCRFPGLAPALSPCTGKLSTPELCGRLELSGTTPA